jgi:two-component system response regulator
MDGRRRSLLLVEDSTDDEALSLRAISGCGVPCDVRVVRHGGEALDQLLAEEGPIPDLIVLDYHLPGRNGLEILRELRKHEKTRHMPIVMLSALESDGEITACLSEGANSCVQKPVDPRLFIDHVALLTRYWLTVDKRPEQTALTKLAYSQHH